MDLTVIRRQLTEEIKTLKNRRGFLGVSLARGSRGRRRAARKEIRQLRDAAGFLKAGNPTFNRLFGRDSLIAAWQLLDFRPGICKATLDILSRLQGKIVNDEREEEPGKILHETELGKSRHPQGYFPFPYYGSVDSTPLFLIVFYLYLHKTNDKKFLTGHWENILMAVRWMEDYGDKNKDYFLEYEKKNPTGLFHQGWKDGSEDHLKILPPVAIVEAQGYQYFALTVIAVLAEIKREWGLARELRGRAEKVKQEFNKNFWMDDEKYFALALDGNNSQRKAITSNPGHLLFCGIVDRDKTAAVIKRLFSPDLWTPYGIRTHSVKEPDFSPVSYHLGAVWPHDNWIIAQGFKKLGYKEEYRKIKNAILAAHQKMGYLPEFYGVDADGRLMPVLAANYPQAWATGALMDFVGRGIAEKALRLPRNIFRRPRHSPF